MFMFHVALSLSLIALTAGCALYVFTARCEGKGTCFASAIAILVILLSITSTLCTMYFGVKAWQQGYEQCLMHDKSMMGDTTPMNKMNEKMNMNQSKNPAHAH